jgi:hypothetical protein
LGALTALPYKTDGSQQPPRLFPQRLDVFDVERARGGGERRVQGL